MTKPPSASAAASRGSRDPQLLLAIATGTLVRTRASLAAIAAEVPEHAEFEAVKDAVPPASGDSADLDELWARVTGRTPYEQALSLHLVGGIVADALAEFGVATEWEAWQQRLVAVLTTVGAADRERRDRLAMWGRRVAGDAVVWATTLRAGVDVEALAARLFANHSRRMNKLGMAA